MELSPEKIRPRWRFVLKILAFSAIKFVCVLAAVCVWEASPGGLLHHSAAAGWFMGVAMFCGLSIVDIVFARAMSEQCKKQ